MLRTRAVVPNGLAVGAAPEEFFEIKRCGNRVTFGADNGLGRHRPRAFIALPLGIAERQLNDHRLAGAGVGGKVDSQADALAKMPGGDGSLRGNRTVGWKKIHGRGGGDRHRVQPHYVVVRGRIGH